MACSSFFQTAEPDEGLGAGPEAYCVTASLSVQYKAPLTPIPGVFRMDIVKDHIDGKPKETPKKTGKTLFGS